MQGIRDWLKKRGIEGRNRRTINFLKTICFDYPEWIPCTVGLMPATWMKYREDLGMQTSLPMSLRMWRKFLKPSFEAMFGPCRDRGVPV